MEDRRAVTTAIYNLVTKGAPYEVEHRMCWPDSTVRYVINKGESMFDRQQQML